MCLPACYNRLESYNRDCIWPTNLKIFTTQFFKEKFTNATWSKKEMVVSLNKRKACATIHYYIENNNLVVLVYTKDFYLKQQALPYASVA